MSNYRLEERRGYIWIVVCNYSTKQKAIEELKHYATHYDPRTWRVVPEQFGESVLYGFDVICFPGKGV